MNVNMFLLDSRGEKLPEARNVCRKDVAWMIFIFPTVLKCPVRLYSEKGGKNRGKLYVFLADSV